MLLINFEKAFYSLAWTFIQKVFEFYNFSNLFIEGVKLFYNNIVSCVSVNGHLSDRFSIHRGCRQGDPLSPYSFIICTEILTLLIKTNLSISGIKVEDTEFLVSQ